MKTPRVIVLCLAFVSCSLYLSAQRMGMDPSLPSQSPFSNQGGLSGNNSPFNSHADNRSISGTVQDTQNNSLKDVRVELTDANGIMVASTYTSVSGHFEFNRLSPGAYTVVTTSGLQQSSERVDATSFSNNVSIRM